MSDPDFSEVRTVLESSETVKVILGPEEDYVCRELSGEAAAHMWDSFPERYEIDIQGYSSETEKYAVALKYRHQMDDEWGKMVFIREE